jgi:type II secretory pathway pseudopilin PulG
MNRHFWRACDRGAGFSFVELLVTIIIAGIAFAAMVPLFVQAQGANSADQARNIALQVAQDKIEKVRQLDYDQITQANLESGSYAGGQFGTTWDFVRNGNTKPYTVQYLVDPVPANAAAGQEKYKKVQVRVTWAAPPSPVKAAVLQTLVYRQYAGPEIQSVTVGPPSVFDTGNPDVPTIIGSPVVIDVFLSPEDIASMNANDLDPAKRGWITFTVSPYTGGGAGDATASQEVRTVYNNEPGHYQYVWDNSAAADGIYKFEMTAFSANAMQGSTATSQFYVELLNPPAPTNLVALPGNGQVSLSWDVPGIGDLDHYELWRGETSGGETLYQSLTNPSYTDTAVTNGTTYYYMVRVVDTAGHMSSFSAEASATPAVQSDTEAPTVPTNLTAVKLAGSGTINLAWTASTDLGTPASGVLGYVIERSPNGVSGWIQLQGSYPNFTYPDSSAGWSSTWYYRVAALDNAGNTSAFTPRVGPVTTDPQPKYSLTVNNTQGYGIYIWVQNVGTGQWYSRAGVPQGTKPAGVNIKKNKSDVWSDLPSGVYNVYASTASGGTPAISSKSGSGDLTAGNNTISF